jgi:glycosyltransferase involved in cell wall biosynthesis
MPIPASSVALLDHPPQDTSVALQRVAILGNHLPRQCGIATFTSHLRSAVDEASAGIDCFVLAVNDPGKHYSYSEDVRFELSEGDTASYQRAADYLNVNGVDVLSLQHEFGIFGGKSGKHLLLLLRELRMPVVTTLHTVLREPNPAQRTVMEALVRTSERLVVMSAYGAEVLQSCYGVPESKIDLIPHGIPSVPPTADSKRRTGVDGHAVLLTFGLLSSDKGIEYVIEALPAIVAAHPEVVYVVLGATHPHVKERHGEAYRLMLETKARQLGVDQHVIFHDRFVSQDELTEFLGAADIYVTPYLNPEQSTSGTLAYALGSGRAVISTPYLYARELLADDRGVLVPWRDPAAIGSAVIRLLDNDGLRLDMQRRAAAHGRSMLWPAVGRQYIESFSRARDAHASRHRATLEVQTLAHRTPGLPAINLKHVRVLTDDTGLLQHATFCVPRYNEGYCLDDNARALMLMARLEDTGADDGETVRSLATRYLAFIDAAFNPPIGRFRNFLSYSRTWLEESGSEDSHGRGLHALGVVVGRSGDPGRQSLAGNLFHAALPAVRDFTSPRAWASTLLGIDEYLRAFEGDRSVQALRTTLAERLLQLLATSRRPDWPWFEDRLTYANAQLPHALLVSGARLQRDDMVASGLTSLEWLVATHITAQGHFTPVGTNGFHVRDQPRADFDQQPIEASTVIAACLDAARVADEAQWRGRARRTFDWFLGENALGYWLYDTSTGGCRDGLHADRVNENQGAESTLAFQLALVDMRDIARIESERPVTQVT